MGEGKMKYIKCLRFYMPSSATVNKTQGVTILAHFTVSLLQWILTMFSGFTNAINHELKTTSNIIASSSSGYNVHHTTENIEFSCGVGSRIVVLKRCVSVKLFPIVTSVALVTEGWGR